MAAITYQELRESEINMTLFQNFIRRQVVKKCWRHINGEWIIREDPFRRKKIVYFRPFGNRKPGILQKMGCVEAKKYSAQHVEAEPFDCQLECEVTSDKR